MMSSGLASEALSYLMVLEARSRTRMWKVWFMPPSKPGTHFMWKVSEDWLITEQFSTGSGATANIFPLRGNYVRWKEKGKYDVLLLLLLKTILYTEGE